MTRWVKLPLRTAQRLTGLAGNRFLCRRHEFSAARRSSPWMR